MILIKRLKSLTPYSYDFIALYYHAKLVDPSGFAQDNNIKYIPGIGVE